MSIAYFDVQAKNYHPHPHIYAWKVLLIKEFGTGNILDAGCADGTYLPACAKAGTHVVGIDLSEEMVAAAKYRCRKSRTIHVVHGDLLHFTSTLRFDVIFCLSTLYYIQEQEAVIKALARTLRPGGILLVDVLLSAPETSVPQFYASYGLYQALFERQGLAVMEQRTEPNPSLLSKYLLPNKTMKRLYVLTKRKTV